MSKEKKKFRMTLPKSESDYETIEKEIREEEEPSETVREASGIEALGGPEDATVLLLNSIAHTLGHIELELNNLNTSIQDLKEGMENIRNSMKTLTKAILYISSSSSEKLRKTMLRSVLEELINE